MSVQPPEQVRLALPSEARLIADVQRRVWTADEGSAAAALLRNVDVSAMEELWARAITAPPTARHRVLVAVASRRVVGFAVTGPSPDPDAQPAIDGAIEELAVDPVARKRGHGSRLLNACADTLRADGFTRARVWMSAVDDQLRRFLQAAGWVADGASREIGSEDAEVRIKQVRLHTDLS